MLIPQVVRLAMRRTGASLLAAGVLAAATFGAAAAQSQPARPPSDRIDLVGLTTRQPSADSPTNQVQFQATVNYRLQSVPTGTVLLFLFENGAGNSSQDASRGIPIQQGSGQLVMNMDYVLKPDVKSLTLVAGLFKSEQKLLAWVSTNPIDMAPWPGRVSFEKAMVARLNNDFEAAAQELTLAIQDAPDTGNYYYWRGDTRIRLRDYGDALTDFDRSLELMPQDRPSRIGHGIANLWLGNAQAAVDDLTMAIDTRQPADRSMGWAYRARGLARASLGLTDAAVADYRAYLTISPDAADRGQIEGWIKDLSG